MDSRPRARSVDLGPRGWPRSAIFDRAQVIGGAGAIDIPFVFVSPGDERADDIAQGSPQRRKRVFDARRHDGIDGSSDQAVAFEVPECDREHPLADAIDAPAQLRETSRAICEKGNYVDGPLVAHALQHFVGCALRGCGRAPVWSAWHRFHGYLHVTRAN